MNKPDSPPRPLILHDLEPDLGDFHQEVLAGLSGEAKQLPCKFFYDQAGSRLFDQICNLDEYYLTRTEIRILQDCAADIAALAGERCLLVEYGSGSSLKVRTLIDRLQPAIYMPIDISRQHLLESARRFALDYPRMEVVAVCADYGARLQLPERATSGDHQQIAFFPGSSLGNFTEEQALAFLRRVASQLATGAGLVIGLDLVKEEAILHAAYNDAQGITAAFNLNLLRRINRELGGTFDLRRFRHQARYNRSRKRIEMHLESSIRQRVRIGDREFDFAKGETIHTENSHKYEIGPFHDLARQAGLQPVKTWTDARDWFSVHYLRKAG